MGYCRKLTAVVQGDETLLFCPPIAERPRFLEEMIEDSAERLKLSADEDAKVGHMAVSKARQGKKGEGRNQADTYNFDVEKCRCCPMSECSYKLEAKTKTCSVTTKQDIRKAHKAFQETDKFKEKVRERYHIEVKNSE